MLYQEARYATQYTRYQARIAALQEYQDAASQIEARWIQQIVIGLSSFTPMVTDPSYRTSDGGLDLEARLEDMWAADPDLRDLDPQGDFSAANQYYIEAQLLAGMVIPLIVSIAFLTLAEIVRSRARIILALVGAALFLLGLAGALITELYFVLSRLL